MMTRGVLQLLLVVTTRAHRMQHYVESMTNDDMTGVCSYTYDDWDRYPEEDRACRKAKSNETCVSMEDCQWNASRVPPSSTGRCEFDAERHDFYYQNADSKCRRVNTWEDCVEYCVWIEKPAPGDGYCDWGGKHADNLFPYQSPDQVRECRQASSWSECVGPCYWSEGGKAPTRGHCDMLQKFIGPEADYWYGRLKKHYHNTPPEKILKWPENERACRKIKEWKTCVGECHWLYDEIRSDGCCTHEKELRNGPRLEPCNLGITNWEDCVGNCTWWNRFQCK